MLNILGNYDEFLGLVKCALVDVRSCNCKELRSFGTFGTSFPRVLAAQVQNSLLRPDTLIEPLKSKLHFTPAPMRLIRAENVLPIEN